MADGRVIFTAEKRGARLPSARRPAPEPRRRRLPPAVRAARLDRLRVRDRDRRARRTATSRWWPRRSAPPTAAARSRSSTARSVPTRTTAIPATARTSTRSTMPAAGRVRRRQRRVPLACAAAVRARLLAACDLEAAEPRRAARAHFGLCELDPSGAAPPRMLLQRAATASRSSRSRSTRARRTACSRSRGDEVNGSTRDRGRRRATPMVHYLDVPLLAHAAVRQHARRAGRSTRASAASSCSRRSRRRAVPPASASSARAWSRTSSASSIKSLRSLGKRVAAADGSVRVRVPGGMPIALGADRRGRQGARLRGRRAVRRRDAPARDDAVLSRRARQAVDAARSCSTACARAATARSAAASSTWGSTSTC